MKKIFALMILMTLVAGVGMAQTFKMGHVQTEKILTDLPDYQKNMKTLEQAQIKAQKELRQLDSLYKKRVLECQQIEDPTQGELLACQQDIADLEQRIQSRGGTLEQKLANLQQTMQADISKKVNDAIKVVADAGQYTYIIEAQALYYIKNGNDITNEVRKELGLDPVPLDGGDDPK